MKNAAYFCTECGAESLKWQGQCGACGAWNTLRGSPGAAKGSHSAGAPAEAAQLSEVTAEPDQRLPTGLAEFDRVLGGGLVKGSAVLLGGDPGIGKSTILLQVAGVNPASARTLYVTGEESLQQLSLRARRLGLAQAGLRAIAETSLDAILAAAESERPEWLIIDSVQTLSLAAVGSAPGSPAQLRECTAALVRLAKTQGIAVTLVGHVTKEGQIAGPRMLEHMVDVVLYFESESGSRFRLLRSVKNRFGAVNELGVFVMDSAGLKQVRNPSAIFLAGRQAGAPGSAVTACHEGSRPMLLEVQALVSDAGAGLARRVSPGMDRDRLAMLMAVLARHSAVSAYDRDVFVNFVGGLRITETAADLAVAAAVWSSVSNQALPEGLILFGEIGLSGEVRPAPYGEERLREAAKLGFQQAMIPAANRPRKPIAGMEISVVKRLEEALSALPRV
ncbi:DNA repair protein RadA [Candidatus Foliamicus sp.]